MTHHVVQLTSALLLLVSGATLAAQSAPADGSAAAQQTAKPKAGEPREYVIGPEDVLDIAVWDNTQVSRTVPVRADGKISLPLLNDVVAAGLTPMQLRDQLTAALRPFIPNATVSVIVREMHSFKVTVMGEVKTPGRFEMRTRSTVMDALALAGGFTEYAGRGRIMVMRRRGTSTYQMPFDYGRVANGDSPSQNIELEPGDIIVVP